MAKQPTQMQTHMSKKTDAGMDTLRTRALDVHEVRVGGRHKTLELVPALLGLSGGVEEVNGESLVGPKYQR